MAAAKTSSKAPRLYRREWVQTNNPLVNEARSQTLAIQRLQVWLRLGYALLATSFLLGYWGFAEGGGTVAGVLGIALGVISLMMVVVLRVGISNGRKNVTAMLDELEGTR